MPALPGQQQVGGVYERVAGRALKPLRERNYSSDSSFYCKKAPEIAKHHTSSLIMVSPFP